MVVIKFQMDWPIPLAANDNFIADECETNIADSLLSYF